MRPPSTAPYTQTGHPASPDCSPQQTPSGDRPGLIVLTDEQEHQAARYLQDQTAIASIGLCRTFVRGMVNRINEVREAGL